ncbi:MAG: hypothetical protein FWG66_00200 [Spirochaetes bacterium]|nr:hypothetical protein [Spirochaetota bacterium]
MAAFHLAGVLSPLAGFLILLPLVYWCFDEKKGLHLGIAVLVSGALHIIIAGLLDRPAPLFASGDPIFAPLVLRQSWFPSAAAQQSLVIWGLLAFWLKKKWFWAAASSLCLLTALYLFRLGFYLPKEILAGWAGGGLVIAGYFALAPLAEKYLSKGGTRWYMIACAALSFLMIFNRTGDDSVVPAGMILGIGAGFYMNRRYIGFASGGEDGGFFESTPWKKKPAALSVRFAAGGAVLFLLMWALRSHLPQYQDFENYPLLAFVAFALPMLWVFAGAPWLFIQIKAARALLPEQRDGF